VREFAKAKREIGVVRCPVCGRHFFRGKESSVTDAVKTAVRTVLEQPEFEVRLEGEMAYVTVKGTVNGVLIEKALPIHINIASKTCAECSRLRGGYWEAKVQLRSGEQVNPAALRSTARHLQKVANWHEEVKGGTDYFFVSREAAEEAVARLKKRAEITRSGKLKGMREGKRVVQMTYSVCV
jgi:NMD protein affecting ribosome stability and mRNA decay